MSTLATASPSRLCPVPVIGVIGGIGSGKSSVARWVADRHFGLVIDGDRLGHQVLEQSNVKDRLRDAFGPEIFDDTGGVIRSLLGRKVFGPTESHQAARRTLEDIVHPEIRRRMEKQLRAVDPAIYRFVLLDAAVMLETGWSNVCDEIVFIDTPVEVRRARVAARGWSAEDLARRESSQWPLDTKRSAASHIIPNAGTLDNAGSALWEFVQHRCGPASKP
jgi:dephospho-CoA kinase